MLFRSPRGLRGNDDSGAMSAWYVFAAAGFYPVTPGVPEYVIVSPLFEKITIDNGADKEPFIITAKYASNKNGFIQSAVLNGKNMAFPLLKHSDIVNGGTLELIMGDKPNREWGKGALKVYYSVSTEHK